MKYRLQRNRKNVFQSFSAIAQVALESEAIARAKLESAVVPHYSEWYDVGNFQELANQLEFRGEAESDDQVLDELGNVVGDIAECLCQPVLVMPDGAEFMGPLLSASWGVPELSDEEYAKQAIQGIAKKSN